MINMDTKAILKLTIDMHVHIGPEIIPRKFTAITLAKKEEGKLGGAVLKSHFFPTVPFAKEAGKTGIRLIGSVTLNNYLGGLNPDAIRSSAELSEGPIVVWFPTINANNFLLKSKYEIAPEWVGNNKITPRLAKEVSGITITDKDGNLSPKAMEVLKAIKQYRCILATGHISWEEAEKLVKEASEMGIKKIIITHPIYQRIDMPNSIQKELVEKGAYIEVAASMYYIDKIPIEKIAEQIKFVGAENCILTSDSGQEFSEPPSKVLEGFMNLLEENGITEKELRQMLIYNPAKLLS